MAMLWQILYGFLVMCGKGFVVEMEAATSPWMEWSSQYNPVFPERYLYTGSKEKYSRQVRTGLDGDLKKDIIKLLMKRSLDNNVTGLLLRALEDEADLGSSGPRRSEPSTFLFHKTLQKIEGTPRMIKGENGMLVDGRIRVLSPSLGSLRLQDVPLISRLGEVGPPNHIGPFRGDDGHVSIEKLKRFLNRMIKKPDTSLAERLSDSRSRRMSNLMKRWDWLDQKSLRNKSELMKILTQSLPLQVSLIHGDLLNSLDKGDDISFKPEQFLLGIANNPSFALSTNGLSRDESILKQISDNTEAARSAKNGSNLALNAAYTTDSRNSSNDSSSRSAAGRGDDKIHQSAEDTVFKSFLNELISDIPNSLDLSTNRPVETIDYLDALLKDKDRLKEIESRVKASKHSVGSSTANPKKSYPCMKIRVKNGPVTLTFQSEVRRAHSTKKPYTDPSNIPVFKISGENSSSLAETNSLIGSSLSSLTEDMNTGECGSDVPGKSNLSSYFTSNSIETQASDYISDNTNIIDSVVKKKKFRRTNSEGLVPLKDAVNGTVFSNATLIPAMVQTRISDQSNLADQLNLSANPKNVTGASNETQTYQDTGSFVHNNISYVTKNLRTGLPIAIAYPLMKDCNVFPHYLNSVQRIDSSKNPSILTNVDSCQLSQDINGFKLDVPFNRSSYTDSRWKYFPKLYYNELVVSKGLVGQHPPKDDLSRAFLSDSTLKKMEMLNILKFYLDSLSPKKNYSSVSGPYIFNPMLKNNKKYLIKL